METDLEKSISETYKDIFQVNIQLLNLVDAALRDVHKKQLIFEKLNRFEAIFIVLFSRCRKKFETIQLLCKKGYGDSGGLILRSMINALIDVYYIKTDPDNLGERYLRYDFVIRKKKMDILKKYNDPNFPIPFSKESEITEEEILKGYEEFKKDYPGSLGDWSGLQIKAKAEAAKQKFPEGIAKSTPMIYDLAYKYYSDFEHNNVMALRKHMDSSCNGRLIIYCEPSEDEVKLTSEESFLTFIQLFDLFCNTFKLDYSQKIKELIEYFKGIV